MNLRTTFKTATLVCLVFLCMSTFFSCKKKAPFSQDPAFAQYISAFTSGTLSAAGTIRVRLTDAFLENAVLNEPIKEKWLEFSPSIEGDLVWIDNQTLEFRPKEWMKRGETYEATFQLAKLTQVPENLKEFEFSFTVMQQHMETEIQSIKSYRNDDLRWMTMSGVIRTMDVVESSSLEKTLNASEGGRKLAISWTPSTDIHLHYFSVDSIERKEVADSVRLEWNGEAIGALQKGSQSQEIPALGDFKVFFWTISQQPQQYVALQFSDPLDPTQNLEGLIDLENAEGEKFTIENNEVRVFTPYRLAGAANIFIHTGIKNIMGYPLTNEQSISVTFEELKPDVEIPEGGVILPSSDGLVMPFRAVNLSSVDVKVIRVYENNVAQFLQVNDLDGNREMRRVGRQVAKKTIPLNADGKTDLANWNTFYLDLDKLIKAEPGAIYRIEIGFRKIHSLYHCEGDTNTSDESTMESTEENWDENVDNETSYWDYYEDYYYDEYYDDYYWDDNYSQRDNPCDDAYYSTRKAKAKNIFASDLGLIAKKGTNATMDFFVADLKTTQPIEGVELEVLNFQQQLIAKLKTDNQGKATAEKISGTPFLLVAKKGTQRGYLKLEGSHSLSTSTFDVGGNQTEKGLKGFLYGERGVWRPGDTLFLAFILQDELKVLPENHPINFELINPRGKVIQKSVKSKSENGFYRLTTKTDPDAETGNYTANVRVGGATFSKTLKIETIKPNRLKLALDFGKEKITAIDQDLVGELSAKWLHGAIAKNLKANVSATFTQASTSFDKYTDYNFDDPIRSFVPEEQVVFDGKLSADGKANIKFDLDLKDLAPGMVNANFSVKVFEEGGDFSTDRFSIPYAPYALFVGMRLPKGDAQRGMLLTDTDQKVEVVTVDAKGKGMSMQNLRWTVYKVQWRWWWEKNNDDLANYVGQESTTPIASGTINTSTDGRGNFAFQVHYPDWGRYLVRVEDTEGGHATGQTVYVDWPGWAGRAQRENPGGASMLMFSTNKDKYIVGDECEISFPSSGVGRALVSIENGTEVLESYWVEAKKDQTTFKFKTTTAMAPNAYLNVTLIQPHKQTENDLPIRLFGVVPLFVENPGSHLDPVISMKEELEPEKKFDVKVSEKSGKAMTYTIAIVDEGLLDLTRFKTPHPWDYFYAREALGVTTYDMYDQVIGAYGGKIDRLLSIGGSDDGPGKGKNRANRFKPVVMYAGPFTIEAGKSASHSFTMPNYIGSVRVMVVAGKDPAYGCTEKAVPVKKPLMVLATLPRVLGPGEEVKLPVNVFVMDKNIKNVSVKVEPNDLFTLSDRSTQTITFSQPGDEVINFNLKVNDKVGVGKVKVTVSSGSIKSTYDVEMDVRNPNPVITEVSPGIVDAGKTWSTTFDVAGMAGTNTTILEVSSIPAVDFGRRLKYLLDYPHGCVEQTTSGAFPQLFLADVIEMGEVEKQRANDNVKLAINKLAKFQISSGAMSYWPGEAQENQWGTNYAGHFMLEAKAKGFTLPSGWESSWMSYQKRAAQNWRPMDAQSGNYYWTYDDQVQAYRLYTLALAGQADLGAMNRLREYKTLSLAGRWRLAAAYALAGQKETANSLVNGASTVIAEYSTMSFTYGSNWRDEAMIVETMVLLDKRIEAANLVKELAQRLSSDSWYSTQTTAYGLLAISKFAGKAVGNEIHYTYTLNGKTSPEFLTKKAIMQNTLNPNMKGNSIEIKNTSGGLLYVRVIRSGQPMNGSETASENKLKMSVRYLDMNGHEISVSRMDQGTDFMAEVTVTHPGIENRYDELALSQIFPSGWEIINSRLDLSASVNAADQPEYLDIRDDRVFSYFDLYSKQSKKFRIKLNATYLGRYYLPAVNCEAMYDHTINARTKGQWVEVVSPGSTAQK